MLLKHLVSRALFFCNSSTINITTRGRHLHRRSFARAEEGGTFCVLGIFEQQLQQRQPGQRPRLRVFMQQGNSATLGLQPLPKRTARKGVKAGDKALSNKRQAAPEHQQQQQEKQQEEERQQQERVENDSSGDDALLNMDWQRFCKTEVPVLVRNQMRVIKELELELGENLIFGGPRGSLRGRPGAAEDYKHRAFYETLSDSEEKLQNFAARQLACRILGSKDYACENCWLPLRDCMCQALERDSLPGGVCLWVYMHPKDFLRKNNTGKLLWQIFGPAAVKLTVCGVQEQEEAMWDVFKEAGRDLVWCLYPEKSPPDYRVSDILIQGELQTSEKGAGSLHFILIDGTWSNSKSMISRLKERAVGLWGEGGMPCVALSPTSVSVMHDLRPQPSTERTCTAAAAGLLLQELSERTELASLGLDHSAELVDAALDCLQDALTTRRARMGRPTARTGRAFSTSNGGGSAPPYKKNASLALSHF